MLNLIYGIICIHDDAKQSKQTEWLSMVFGSVPNVRTTCTRAYVRTCTAHQAIANWQQNHLLLFDKILVDHIENCFMFAPLNWTRLRQTKREQSTKSNEMLNLHCLYVQSIHWLLYTLVHFSHCVPYTSYTCLMHNCDVHVLVHCASIFHIEHIGIDFQWWSIYTQTLWPVATVMYLIKNHITQNACLMFNATTTAATAEYEE